MDIYHVVATGNFLQWYYSDLEYFLEFQHLLVDTSRFENNCIKGSATFKNFINEYRVARSVEKMKTKKLLTKTLAWKSKHQTIEVDDFAKFLNKSGLTHGKNALSLASKILYLSDPWNVFPFDSQAKKSLKSKCKTYSEYYYDLMNYKDKHESEINSILKLINPHVELIEKNFKNKLFKVELIRFNRMTDKILWSGGNNKNYH